MYETRTIFVYDFTWCMKTKKNKAIKRSHAIQFSPLLLLNILFFFSFIIRARSYGFFPFSASNSSVRIEIWNVGFTYYYKRKKNCQKIIPISLIEDHFNVLLLFFFGLAWFNIGYWTHVHKLRWKIAIPKYRTKREWDDIQNRRMQSTKIIICQT